MIYTKEEAHAKYPNVEFCGNKFTIRSNVTIRSHVTVGANVTIGRDGIIGRNVTVGANVTIGRDVIIGRRVTIRDNAIIEYNVTLMRGAVIGHGTTIRDNVIVAPNAFISPGSEIPRGCINARRTLLINGLGQYKELTAVDCDDGLIIGIGCMNDYKGLPIEEAREEIAKRYPDENHLYYSALRLAQEWYDAESEGVR